MLKRVGKSHSQLAREIDMAPRQMRRLISGETPIRRIHEYAIRYLLESQGLR